MAEHGVVLAALGDPDIAGERAAATVAEARAALRAVSRRGFGVEERRDPGAADAFAAGAAAVRGARDLLVRLRGAVEAALPPAGRTACFEADRAVFADRFRALYGAAP